jgi:predicted nucleic-acid-binding Zn-ribbon protein
MKMAYWKLKSCPKCRGDVFVEKEGNSSTAYCLQCGSRSYSLKIPRVEHTEAVQQRELVAVN